MKKLSVIIKKSDGNFIKQRQQAQVSKREQRHKSHNRRIQQHLPRAGRVEKQKQIIKITVW